MILTPCPPFHTLTLISLLSYLPFSDMICNNNTMDMAFLVEMRQSNECGSVTNNEIINLHLGSGADP